MQQDEHLRLISILQNFTKTRSSLFRKEKVSLPTLSLQIPSPRFEGTTGGWLRAAKMEEKYVIIWVGKREQIFEMPTSGSAIMRQGENLLYLAKKEQCLALGTQLRGLLKISDYRIYRIFPNSKVQYLHPKDGVFPEKLNEGRVGVGNVYHSIGKNPQPVNFKFTGCNTFD
jgi:photosystem I subunit 2